MNGMRPKAIDLFSGAGGLSLGLYFAGFDVVGAVEFDSHACKTYRHNFGNHVVEADITMYGPKELELFMKNNDSIQSVDEIELVAGGPPCPGFSNIGRSKILSLIKKGVWAGSETRHAFIEDPRNQLFHHFIKYVDHYKPSFCLMENVSGMNSYKNSDEIPIIEIIKSEFKRIGYNVKTKILIASDFGVPQKRKRIFFLGWKKGLSEPNFPLAKGFQVTSRDAICDLPDSWEESTKPIGIRLKKLSEIRGIEKTSQSFLKFIRSAKPPRNGNLKRMHVNLHRSRIVNPRDIGIFPLIKSGEHGQKIIFRDLNPATINFPYPWKWNKSRGIVWNGKMGECRREYKWYNPGTFGDKMRRIRGDQPAPTIVAHLTHDGYMFIHPDRDRTITVREAARFQSFPDKFDFSADGKVSWTKQFEQVGNAVPPLLAQELGISILEAISHK